MIDNVYSRYVKRSIFSKALQVILWPVAILSFILPKKNIALFSSMNGYKIADNTKYLFLNFNDKDKFWVTKNKNIVSTEHKIFWAYSIKGMWLQLIAREAYYTHGIYDFIPCLIWGARKVNLWHGVPLKEIGPKADNKNNSFLKKKLKKWVFTIFPYTYYMACDEVICPRENRIEDYNRFFSVSKPKIILQKQPRNIYAIKNEKANKILISPTFRTQQDWNPLTILNLLGCFDSSKELKKLGYKIVFRPHPIDLEKVMKQEQYLKNHGIELDATTDLYETITSYKFVITDYSSIFYDCLELDIKCYLFIPDIVTYTSTVGLTEFFAIDAKNKTIKNIMDIFSTSSC